MKYLVVGGLLTVGIIAAGSITVGLLRDNSTEQADVAQSRSAVSAGNLTSGQDSQDLSGNASEQVSNDVGPQNTSVYAASSNVTNDAIVKVSLYGNTKQSGHRVHQAIYDLVQQGNPVKASILQVINSAVANQDVNLLSPAALTSTKNHKSTVLAFMAQMVAANDLFPATKSSIEEKPDDVLNIIDAAVVLYPDFAQEVINAATLTGLIDPNEALLAAIAAGADPTTVSEATAAGGAVTGAGQPFDGLGGGGNGGGDASASSN
jgi:hypothetical protein